MGKPRMIILVRHAQSEGNKNRDIHQLIPDHRVKLTPDGRQQAEEAGRRLRSMLKPDDTLQFYTSPYRRTRETTEGILQTLTADEPNPSPFPRHKITVYEEPRLREQDFGNFQPCSAEMERMWQERADYGHFFYRIPNGESAADAYDRVSGFNESMWRQFSEPDFPSVCVLVTHGLMTRVFLMKWYHWSVEYFEDLRNVNHCEFIVMKHNPDNGKFILQNELRTWSDLKRRTALTQLSTEQPKAPPVLNTASPVQPLRKWGGCSNGCNHAQINYPRRTRRTNTSDLLGAAAASAVPQKEKEDGPLTSSKDLAGSSLKPVSTSSAVLASKYHGGDLTLIPDLTDIGSPPLPTGSTDAAGYGDVSSSADSEEDDSPNDGGPPAGTHRLLNHSHGNPAATSGGGGRHSHKSSHRHHHQHHHDHSHRPSIPTVLRLNMGRDFGGSRSGAATPAEGFSDDSDYAFPQVSPPAGEGTTATTDTKLNAVTTANETSPAVPAPAPADEAAPSATALSKLDTTSATTSAPDPSDTPSTATASNPLPTTNSDEKKPTPVPNPPGSPRSARGLRRARTNAEWAEESGMGGGARADALGDDDWGEEDEDADAGAGPGAEVGKAGGGLRKKGGVR